jgi:hypothetical protein
MLSYWGVHGGPVMSGARPLVFRHLGRAEGPRSLWAPSQCPPSDRQFSSIDSPRLEGSGLENPLHFRFGGTLSPSARRLNA